MALNQPYTNDEFLVSDIIDNNLDQLLSDLRKEGVILEKNDIVYELFTRCEYLGVLSEKIYPSEDLPDKFGVYRGYNGGGLHGGLVKTEIDRLTASRKAKADRLLELFKKYFWLILKEVDSIDEQETGETKPDWERLTI